MRAREPGVETPLIAPATAGANLAALAHDHEFVFYESFLPDLAGHGRLGAERATQASAGKEAIVTEQVHTAIALLDGLLGGLLVARRPGDTMLVTSDHGNIESLAAPAHTRDPVPLLVVGPGAPAFADVEDIAGVAGAILAAL
ncbi:hypothetical protein SE17_34660, partial [Kouleothrix aurantiaca]